MEDFFGDGGMKRLQICMLDSDFYPTKSSNFTFRCKSRKCPTSKIYFFEFVKNKLLDEVNWEVWITGKKLKLPKQSSYEVSLDGDMYTTAIEILHLLNLHRVLHEKDSMTGYKVVTIITEVSY